MKMSPWFKTALAMAVVIGPIYWLMFTNDGQRRSDAAMLWLFGTSSIELDLRALGTGYTRDQLGQVYPDLDWQCSGPANTGAGAAPAAAGTDTQVCNITLGTYNNIPAHRIVFHFINDRLVRLRVDYRRRYHQALLEQLQSQFGRPAAGKAGTAPRAVLEWPLTNGLVVAKRTLEDGDDSVLFWLYRPSRSANGTVSPTVGPTADR